MNLPQAFTVDEEGYALMHKLIQIRIDESLELEYARLNALESRQRSHSGRTGKIHPLNEAHRSHAAAKAADEIHRKQEWKTSWEKQILKKFPPSLIKLSAEQLIQQFSRTSFTRVQLFMIMQDAIHTPIFCDPHPDEEVAEAFSAEPAEAVSQRCGFGSWGGWIYKSTETFFKEIRDEGGTLLNWGNAGLARLGPLAAELSAPAVIPLGHTDVSAGLAISGCGTEVPAGCAVADRVTVLVGGSHLLGAVGSGSDAHLLGQIPQEAVALNVVKIINLIRYLKSDDNRDPAGTRGTLQQAQELFLQFKHRTETEMALNGLYRSRKDRMQMSHILNRAFRQIIKQG